jgi:ABC-type lipoprotein release transport system permease subunit
MLKRFTYVTTYIVQAVDERTANEVKEKVVSQLQTDTLVLEDWTNLTDIEDIPDEENSMTSERTDR